MQNANNTNKWINWIEESISKEYYKLYEHENFSDIQKIGTGGFGKVYRARWNNSQCLALKSFFNLNNVTAKEIVHELKLQRNIQFHNNIIKYYGIAKFDPENKNSQSNNYLLVMEFNGQSKNKSSEKSDIYSVGVLLWEISSGKPPFYSEGEQYDVGLALGIAQGLREKPVPDTPEDYIEIYTECWNGEPDKRPTINHIVERLEAIMTKENIITKNYQTELSLRSTASTSTDGQNFNPTNIDTLSNIDNSLHGEMD
ncbi:unnamed protein product [Rhizophagus irregularis]|nr:unnamed protein product [Rhizophagus irregularis]